MSKIKSELRKYNILKKYGIHIPRTINGEVIFAYHAIKRLHELQEQDHKAKSEVDLFKTTQYIESLKADDRLTEEEINSSIMRTNMTHAITANNLSFVKLLVQAGYNIHECYDFPLRSAVSYGKIEIVKYLIEQGADVNAEHGFCITVAAAKGFYNITNVLLKNGATERLDDAIMLAQNHNHPRVASAISRFQQKQTRG
jgi:ankyrin repeat protein